MQESLINKRLVYGRRRGKALSVSRTGAMDDLYSALSIPGEILKRDRSATPEVIFGTSPGTLHFEIGIGNGEHLKYRMQQNPGDYFIGSEIYRDGMAAFLKSVQGMPHDRLRIHMDDAIDLLNSMPDACIDFLYILNPDPWPKARHHKRRMVGPENLDVFARVLKPGGILLETTDVDELAEWMAIHTVHHPAFDWLAENSRDWRTPPDGWLATRYETKGEIAGRRQSYLIFKRR